MTIEAWYVYFFLPFLDLVSLGLVSLGSSCFLRFLETGAAGGSSSSEESGSSSVSGSTFAFGFAVRLARGAFAFAFGLQFLAMQNDVLGKVLYETPNSL